MSAIAAATLARSEAPTFSLGGHLEFLCPNNVREINSQDTDKVRGCAPGHLAAAAVWNRIVPARLMEKPVN
jgi:hypothetical protein